MHLRCGLQLHTVFVYSMCVQRMELHCVCVANEEARAKRESMYMEEAAHLSFSFLSLCDGLCVQVVRARALVLAERTER